MKKNVGTVDRVIRIIIGVVLIVAGAGVFGAVSGALMWVLIIVGAIALVTGLIGWCCAYVALGMSTCKAEPAKEAPPAQEKPAE